MDELSLFLFWTLFSLSPPPMFFLLYGSVWIPLIVENWKYCSKIIFKCVNSVVGPSFKVVFAIKKKKYLWVLWTVYMTYHFLAKRKNAMKTCVPNAHYISSLNAYSKLGGLLSILLIRGFPVSSSIFGIPKYPYINS